MRIQTKKLQKNSAKQNRNLALAVRGFFGSQIHKRYHDPHKSNLDQKHSPKDSSIIDIHDISLNKRMPSIKNNMENVNPAKPNNIWKNPNSVANKPNTQDPSDNFAMSKQNLANSSFWRLVITNNFSTRNLLSKF